MVEIKKHLTREYETVRDCMERLNASTRILFVVDENEKLIGSLTDGDIRRWILSGNGLDEEICKGVMNSSPKYVYESELERAKMLIEEFEILAVPVINKDRTIVNIVFWNKAIDARKSEVINSPVVIMAGGKGERLLPYTSIVPKPLMPIGDKSILELVIDSFKIYGCQDFYFTLNYRKNMIKAYFDDLERDYRISYIEENEPLGTGGSLYYLKDVLKETFFVSNCDILLDVDYADVIKFHKNKGNLITVVTSLKKYTVPYGTVKLDDDGQIEKLLEKPSLDYLVNTGVYAIEPKIFEYMQEERFIHITEIIEKCISSGDKVGTYPVGESAWLDMGQFDEMERMKEHFVKR